MFILRKSLVVFKCLFLILVFVDIHHEFNRKVLVMILLFLFSIIIMINDYVRNKIINKNSKYRYISLFFAICGAAVLRYFVRGLGASGYIFFSLAELFGVKGKLLKIFFLIHGTSFFIVSILSIGVPNTIDKLSNMGITIISYFAVASIIYSIKMIQVEKEETKQLNDKLKLANIKLQEYSLRVKDLTISKERRRVAQELHDSLGHSLMALTMHLEFAKKVMDSKPDKVKEVLEKSEKIAKDSVNDLRKAVNALKEEREIEHLNESIKNLIDNFEIAGGVKVNFNGDMSIDNVDINIKNSIYKTIREALTNSIKHGQATEININMVKSSEGINLIISNNGIGCNKIIKSNGLNGIENRINLLNGRVSYFSGKNSGFSIEANIPI